MITRVFDGAKEGLSRDDIVDNLIHFNRLDKGGHFAARAAGRARPDQDRRGAAPAGREVIVVQVVGWRSSCAIPPTMNSKENSNFFMTAPGLAVTRSA